MEVGDQRHAPAALPPGKDPVLIVQEAGWTPGPVWTVRKLSPSQEFDPRTVQPVAKLRGCEFHWDVYVISAFGRNRKDVRGTSRAFLRGRRS